MRKGTKHISLLEKSRSDATNKIGLLNSQVSVTKCCLPPNGTKSPLGNFRSEAENYKVGGSGCWQENGTENSDWGDLVETW